MRTVSTPTSVLSVLVTPGATLTRLPRISEYYTTVSLAVQEKLHRFHTGNIVIIINTEGAERHSKCFVTLLLQALLHSHAQSHSGYLGYRNMLPKLLECERG